jgi:hypothetical protein
MRKRQYHHCFIFSDSRSAFFLHLASQCLFQKIKEEEKGYLAYLQPFRVRPCCLCATRGGDHTLDTPFCRIIQTQMLTYTYPQLLLRTHTIIIPLIGERSSMRGFVVVPHGQSNAKICEWHVAFVTSKCLCQDSKIIICNVNRYHGGLPIVNREACWFRKDMENVFQMAKFETGLLALSRLLYHLRICILHNRKVSVTLWERLFYYHHGITPYLSLLVRVHSLSCIWIDFQEHHWE